ncbi:MAG: potassium/proton antiporter, partial [Rhizobiales bacterium]|nr:potassium/proton antiporter [Hyphomicrobiales bacterium]
RVRSTLEVESGSNDPAAIFLAISLVELATAPSEAPLLELFSTFALQAGVGGLIGLVGGFVIAEVMNRTNFEAALYPILVLGLALGTFAASGMPGGRGFPAVFIAGVIAGNAKVRHGVTLKRFQEGTTWLSQIAMFLTLGLLATPSEFPGVMLMALGIAIFLTFIARPLAVWLCLLPFSFTRRERAFIAWVGLRGATTILLAIVPVLGGLSYGQEIFNIAFIVVLFSLLVQGWTIAPVARWLKLVVPPRIGPVDRIELELPGRGGYEVAVYVVHPESPVAKAQRIPRWARPALLVRDGRSLRPDRAGRPRPGDQIYVLTPPRYIELLDGMFAGPIASASDPQLYGEFAIDPDSAVVDLAKLYAGRPRPLRADRADRAERRRRAPDQRGRPGSRAFAPAAPDPAVPDAARDRLDRALVAPAVAEARQARQRGFRLDHGSRSGEGGGAASAADGRGRAARRDGRRLRAAAGTLTPTRVRCCAQTPSSRMSRSMVERLPRLSRCAARKPSQALRPSSRSIDRKLHSAFSLDE